MIFYPTNGTFLFEGASKSGDGDFVGSHFTPSNTADGETFISEIRYWPNQIKDIKKVIHPLVKVYPNPAASIINLDFADEVITDDKEVIIRSLNGQQLAKHNLVGGRPSEQLDISNLPAATYVISIYSNKALLFSQEIIIAPK